MKRRLRARALCPTYASIIVRQMRCHPPTCAEDSDTASAVGGAIAVLGGQGLTVCPSDSVMVVRARDATSSSWVTRIIVLPALLSSWSKDKTRCADWESRLPVGSSAMMMSWSAATVRAIAIRCCSPPDSVDTSWCARSSKPTKASASRAFCCRCVGEEATYRLPRRTFSSTLRSGNR